MQSAVSKLREIWGTWKFHLFTAVFAIALVEIPLFALTFAGFEDRYSRLLGVDYDEYVANISDEYIMKARENAYDPDLGWDVRAGSYKETTNNAGELIQYTIDSNGARRNPYIGSESEGDITILAFGESFTFGGEVEDDETWPFYLSEQLQIPVINFGVRAYGPDQAFLKMRRILDRYEPNVVIFGIMSENIGRLMSMYRPFYKPKTGVLLGFKPMLRETPDGRMIFLQNPLSKFDSRADVLRAYEISKRDDYWYKAGTGPLWEFPFSLALARLIKYKIFEYAPGTEVARLYRTPEATRKMDFIVRSFMELAQKREFYPVVVFIPNGADVQANAGGQAHSYAAYLGDLRQQNMDIDGQIIDVLEFSFDRVKFNINPFRAHLSSYGNSAVADILHSNVRPFQKYAGDNPGRNLDGN
jgi:hypothetical protein